MGGFFEAFQCGRRDDSNVLPITPGDDDRLLAVLGRIEDTGEVLAGVAGS